jgi:hypothetical protein
MLFPIVIFLMVLSPLFIPMAVTVIHKFGNLRRRRSVPTFAGVVPALA